MRANFAYEDLPVLLNASGVQACVTAIFGAVILPVSLIVLKLIKQK